MNFKLPYAALLFGIYIGIMPLLGCDNTGDGQASSARKKEINPRNDLREFDAVLAHAQSVTASRALDKEYVLSMQDSETQRLGRPATYNEGELRAKWNDKYSEELIDRARRGEEINFNTEYAKYLEQHPYGE